MSKPERRNKEGMLLGPARPDKYLEWRRARDNAIRNPRRLKTCKDSDDQKKESADNSEAGL